MNLQPGARLGPFVISAAVGAGGMGEVYRARDSRLDRTVAIKVLPAQLSRDTNLRARFVREARAISSFTHPHVCQLYDIGSDDGVDYLVMEFLEGQSLADRLSRGPLPLDQALRHAIEIAKALEAAHRRGIVHRDLKPGNVILTKSGAKLVDFGLATETQSVPDASGETTVQSPLTAEGTVVGTLQYMSPEQLEGRQLDHRSDIFALGAMVYEMVTGRRAFGGTSQASVISAIMTSDPPPMHERAPATPAALERVVQKCLAKDPDDRWQSAADIATALEWVGEVAPQRAAASRRANVAFGVLAAIALAGVALAAYFALHQTKPQVIRFEVTSGEPFAHGLDTHFAVSPDGTKLAFTTTARAHNALWVRTLDSATPRLLTREHEPHAPFWSPDGRVVAYFGSGALYRIATTGGDPEKICEFAGTAGGVGSWSTDGSIVFGTLGKPGTIWKVPSSGGTPQPLARAKDDATYYWPVVIDDAKRVLYVSIVKSHDLVLRAVSLDGSDDRPIGPISSRAEYAAPYLFYALEQGSVVARRFDPKSLTFSGEARQMASGVDSYGAVGVAAFSVSPSAVVTQSGEYVGRATWFDHAGHPLADLPFTTVWFSARISHSGARVALTLQNDFNNDIWVANADGSGATRVTYDPNGQILPVWSPDDTRVAYASESPGPPHVVVRPLGGEEMDITKIGGIQYVTDWSPDGKLIAYDEPAPRMGRDIWMVPVDGARKPFQWLATPFSERFATFSPDGQWIAYVSNATGQNEAYIRRFDRTGEAVRVSNQPVDLVRWSHDGQELDYDTDDGEVYAAKLTFNGNKVVASAPRLLFRVDTRVPIVGFDVAPDGRFLIARRFKSSDTNPITVTLNWR